MDTFEYDYTAEQLAALKSAWQFAQVVEGDYQALDAELDFIDVPVEQEQRRLFAYLFATAYAHAPSSKIAARWHEVLSCAQSPDVLHLVRSVHAYTDQQGTCPEAYDQHFMTWVGHYSRLFNQNSDYLNALQSEPTNARTAAFIVAAQKWMRIKEPGDFYYKLLTYGPERTSMSYMAVDLMNTVALKPGHALLFAIACIYPEVAADSRRPLLRPEHESAEFLMDRSTFAEPILKWLGDVQPQALTWYNEILGKVYLCDSLDVPAKMSVPLIMTEPHPELTTLDNPDVHSVFRSLLRTTSFYGVGQTVSLPRVDLPNSFGD